MFTHKIFVVNFLSISQNFFKSNFRYIDVQKYIDSFKKKKFPTIWLTDINILILICPVPLLATMVSVRLCFGVSCCSNVLFHFQEQALKNHGKWKKLMVIWCFKNQSNPKKWRHAISWEHGHLVSKFCENFSFIQVT